MKTQIDARLLNEAIAMVGKLVPTKSVIQATTRILLEFSEDALLITGGDMNHADISVSITTATTTNSSCVFSVDAQKLISSVSLAAKSSKDITISDEGKRLRLTWPNNEIDLATHDAKEYPKPIRDIGTSGILVDVGMVRDAIRKTSGCALDKAAYEALTGIYFGNGEAATADGYRLAVYSGVKISDYDIVIPSTTAIKVEQILSRITGNVTAYHNTENGKLYFVWDSGIMCTILINMTYPAYRSVFPQEYSTVISIKKQSLESTLNAANLFAVDAMNLVRIRTGGGMLYISSEAQDGKHSGEIECDSIDGPNVTFGMSCKFLADALSHMGPNITISTNGGGTNIIVISDGSGFIYGIMPMHLSS